jgi:hypothetical protein
VISACHWRTPPRSKILLPVGEWCLKVDSHSSVTYQFRISTVRSVRWMCETLYLIYVWRMCVSRAPHGRHWYGTDTALIRNWHLTDTELTRHWYGTDTSLIRNWHVTDTELTRHWYGTDTSPIRVNRPLFDTCFSR